MIKKKTMKTLQQLLEDPNVYIKDGGFKHKTGNNRISSSMLPLLGEDVTDNIRWTFCSWMLAEPIVDGVVGDYVVKVTPDSISIGCQTIDHDQYLNLRTFIDKARFKFL